MQDIFQDMSDSVLKRLTFLFEMSEVSVIQNAGSSTNWSLLCVQSFVMGIIESSIEEMPENMAL